MDTSLEKAFSKFNNSLIRVYPCPSVVSFSFVSTVKLGVEVHRTCEQVDRVVDIQRLADVERLAGRDADH